MTAPENIWRWALSNGWIEYSETHPIVSASAREYTRTDIHAAVVTERDALRARVAELEGALVAAHEMRKAADRVSEWFCTEARHLEGARINALRACMAAYDNARAALSQEGGK